MTNEILNHLVQSTAFAAVCALLTLAVRNNRAQVRYALWVASSAKFLIPFGALVALGRTIGHGLLPPITAHQVAVMFEFVGQPLPRSIVPAATRVPILLERASSSVGTVSTVLVAIWAIGSVALHAGWFVRWRGVAQIAERATMITEGREVAILRRLERERGVRRPVSVLLSNVSMEPGVFGLFTPRLLWPIGMSAHLDESQIEAILAHELSHVRRYDNLVAAVQMGIQAAFWFHPLVWWIGARQVDERERACDEDVLRSGSEPDVYAESILKTCRFSIESPLVCVAGVTGADLKRRIEAIMNHRGADALGIAKRLLLAIAASTAVAGPIAVGVLNAPRLGAQAEVLRIGEEKFEVASVKPNKSSDARVAIMGQPGGRLTATNVPVSMLVRFAYQLQSFQVVGEPPWMQSDRFDVIAKAEHEIPPGGLGTVGPGQLMMRSLLAERFKLAVHMESKEMPIYALVLARSDGRLGANLRRSTVDCVAMFAAQRASGRLPEPPPPGQRPQCGFRIGPGQMTGGGFQVSELARSLSNFVQRIVVDRTGLAGNFDLDLTFTPSQMGFGPLKLGGADTAPPAGDSDAASIFTALQEQLGLKLESTKGPVDVLVVDHAEPPTPD